MEIKDLEINKALPVVPLSDKEMSTVTGGGRTPTPVETTSAAAPGRPKRMVAGRWVELDRL